MAFAPAPAIDVRRAETQRGSVHESAVTPQAAGAEMKTASVVRGTEAGSSPSVSLPPWRCCRIKLRFRCAGDQFTFDCSALPNLYHTDWKREWSSGFDEEIDVGKSHAFNC